MLASLGVAGLGLATALPQTAWANPYPDRPIKIVVGGPPAGGTDFLARLIADHLTGILKQTVMVENRAGASGLIGTKYVLQAAADGHTFLMGQAATNVILPLIHVQPTYDPVNDFTPIGLVATAPEILVVASDSAIMSVADYIAEAKKRPGEISYGTPGIGQPQHILGERFRAQTGTDLLHVPYNGSGPGLSDLVGGRLTSMFVTPGAVMPFIRDGRVRALAVSSAERSSLLPDVPTLEEAGVTGVSQIGWFGLFGPAGIPEDRKQVFEAAVMQVMQDPSVRERITAAYVEPQGTNAVEFAQFQNLQVDDFKIIIDELGIKLN